jgi:hypothetical protein
VVEHFWGETVPKVEALALNVAKKPFKPLGRFISKAAAGDYRDVGRMRSAS